jgi:hypothetical protein
MGLTNFPNGVTSFGIPVVGSGGILIPPTLGNYYFVNSATGSNGVNMGKEPSKPFASLTYAITQVTSNNSDVIIIAPNHTETIAASLALNKEGVTIVGLGNGDDRPTFTLSATTSVFTVTGDNTTIDNIRILGGVDSIVSAVTVQADYFTLKNCELKYTSTYDTLIWVTIGESSALNATVTTGCSILNNVMTARQASGAVKAIYLHGGQVDVNIAGNYITGYYSEAVMADINTTGDTGVSVNLRLIENVFQNGDSTDATNMIDLNAASTGVAAWNLSSMPTSHPVVVNHDMGALRCLENYASNLVDAYDIKISVTASTT